MSEKDDVNVDEVQELHPPLRSGEDLLQRPFAKLFEHPDYNQLVVTQIYDDLSDMIEIAIHFQPKGSGVSTISLYLENNEKGWKDADEIFDELDEESIIEKIESQDIS